MRQRAGVRGSEVPLTHVSPGNECFVGIDVSKEWLDVLIAPDGGKAWRVPNDEAGWTQLCQRLAAIKPTLVVLEATGRLEIGVTLALDAAGMTPVVANPLTIRRFAQSLGRRAKTDRIDAKLLAQYAHQVRPEPRALPTPLARSLSECSMRRTQLVRMRVMEENRRQQASLETAPSVERTIAFLDAELDQIDRQLAELIASDPIWSTQVERLESVPGIARRSAMALMIGLPELGSLTAKEMAALVGVAPYAADSGKHRGARSIASGRRHVRHALYMVTFNTTRWDPAFKAHKAQLRARGKSHKVAMVACMRRLLGILNAMIRDGLNWDQTEVGQGKFLTKPT